MIKNEHSVTIFLNRLNWKTNTGEITDLKKFQIDVFLFKFPYGLGEEVTKAFTSYIRRLKMTELRSVMKIFLWLYQRNIKFKLVFAWNDRLSFMYNISKILEPRRIRKLLLSYKHDDLMECPVELMDKEGE